MFATFLGLSFVLSERLSLPATRPEALQAMEGEWVGVLEYRDYSEPATSTKRVFLPTWLTILPTKEGVKRHFIYDDGPNKTVDETDTVTIDPSGLTYSETNLGKPSLVEHIIGFEKLKNGKGDLVLVGTGTDNDKPTDTRTTLSIRRNLISWILEVRPAKSNEPYSFRHRFTFTRAQTPKV